MPAHDAPSRGAITTRRTWLRRALALLTATGTLFLETPQSVRKVAATGSAAAWTAASAPVAAAATPAVRAAPFRVARPGTCAATTRAVTAPSSWGTSTAARPEAFRRARRVAGAATQANRTGATTATSSARALSSSERAERVRCQEVHDARPKRYPADAFTDPTQTLRARPGPPRRTGRHTRRDQQAEREPCSGCSTGPADRRLARPP